MNDVTYKEIKELQEKNSRFRATELGELFEKFVNLHARAWQLDERSSSGFGEKSASKAWKDLEPIEIKLRETLMKLVGIES